MDKLGLVFSGSGGQGVITSAIVLAEAAVLHEGLVAVQTQLYGAEARGGATRSDVIISRTEIHYPRVKRPNVLVCLTQEAYEKYGQILYPGGLLIVDPKYVELQGRVDAKKVELPMYKTIMEKLGNPIVLNICMLGTVIGLTKVIKLESAIKALDKHVPPDMLEINQQALKLGFEMGDDLQISEGFWFSEGTPAPSFFSRP